MSYSTPPFIDDEPAHLFAEPQADAYYRASLIRALDEAERAEDLSALRAVGFVFACIVGTIAFGLIAAAVCTFTH